MSFRKSDEDAVLGYGLLASTAIHLTVFLVMVWWGRLFPLTMSVKDTYYVDVVNLPVADPRSGSPAQRGDESQVSTPPAPAEQMNLPQPSKPALKPPLKPSNPSDQKKPPSPDEFAKKLAAMEKKAEARQAEEVLKNLSKKVTASGGRAGMPSAGGKEQGSDYSAYLQSRLKDAFRETISYSTKNPEMIVRLFVDGSGKLTRRVPERSSGDKAFELAVFRAIDLASEKFPPPPDRRAFDGVFVFRPQGITPNPAK